MIPGEMDLMKKDIDINTGRTATEIDVANTGDRPIQVGYHYHFYETNSALSFDREAARGKRLNIAAGTAIRFEPGQSRLIQLVEISGDRLIYGFKAEIMGPLESGERNPE